MVRNHKMGLSKYSAITVAMVFFFLVVGVRADYKWIRATATFYGGRDGSGTTQGACGYSDTVRQGYGLETAALSTALFNDGLKCGACFEIMCYNSKQHCLPGTIKITATNFCPPNWALPSDNGGWCNPPRKHFDLTMPMFFKIGRYEAGIIPVLFRRIPCVKSGGVKFEIKGNPYFTLVLVYNVAGAGDVIDMKIKGSSTWWIQMRRNWGQNWGTGVRLQGQSLSFQVTTMDYRMLEFNNVAPSNWQFGQTYEGRQF